ncbi:hypothetical protein Agabi119p4_9920 [Agaricus bisporus var. burnettii]|uniref:F-box domain-containing protein n=1 Tax=Agaricus bisporus var. burnettii TaxID=192524 RepID=A0A8H7C4J2_AGABI|nr:hypothetical protein Agabi119p4_9920 [Agaricus bisporus var. burnettii]
MEVQGLTPLPVEFISRILMHVDSSDISAVKKFWCNHILRLCEEHLVTPPEEELKEYTTAELEQWSMRRIRARSAPPVKWQLHSRDGCNSYDDIQIIPGGRWLLEIHDDSSVHFIDLDNDNLEQHLLLDPRAIDSDPRVCDHEFVGVDIWTDHKAPRLSFRLEGSFFNESASFEYHIP